MPVGFTEKQQEEIREQLFAAGIRLIRELGMKRTTVDKLTKECGIAKGSFYLFYSSKEEFLMALVQYTSAKTAEMLQSKLAGRQQMTVKEFFDFFREYLYSDYDLMGTLTIDDFFWLKEHMEEYHLFDPAEQMKSLKGWMALLSDARKDADPGVVFNLIKCIYAMREHRDAMIQESLDASVDELLRTMERYLCEKGDCKSK